MKISNSELNILIKTFEAEKLLSKKFISYSAISADINLKTLFEELSAKHTDHCNFIDRILKEAK